MNERIQVEESSERWSEFTLEDGTVIRGKLSITSATRQSDQWDEQGMPIYSIQMSPQVVVVSSPHARSLKRDN